MESQNRIAVKCSSRLESELNCEPHGTKLIFESESHKNLESKRLESESLKNLESLELLVSESHKSRNRWNRNSIKAGIANAYDNMFSSAVNKNINL